MDAEVAGHTPLFQRNPSSLARDRCYHCYIPTGGIPTTTTFKEEKDMKTPTSTDQKLVVFARRILVVVLKMFSLNPSFWVWFVCCVLSVVPPMCVTTRIIGNTQ